MKKIYTLLFSLIFVITICYLFLVPEYQVQGLNHDQPISVSFSHVHHIEKIGMVEDNGYGLRPATIFNEGKNLSFDISFSLPGDRYSFMVDIDNEGDQPLFIDVISNELDDYAKQFIYYSVIGDQEVLDAHESMTIQVIVEYKRDIDELPEKEISTTYQTTIVASEV